MAPPTSETRQRKKREQSEQMARDISLRIDEEIRIEKIACKKRKKPVKVLVLGQSESGKTTTIKNFQRRLAPQLWNSERASWRAVIFLNLVHSVNTILNVLTDEMPSSGSASPDMAYGPFEDESLTGFTSNHRLLKLRLGPLYQIQNDLENLLGTPSLRESLPPGLYNRDPFSIPEIIPLHRDFWIISKHGWKSALDRVSEPCLIDRDVDGRRYRSPRRGITRTEDVADVIAGCAADIKALWADAVVQNMLRKRELVLEDWAGFFLHDVDRIADRDYMPSDEDIMHARLQTMGVQEYQFHIGDEIDIKTTDAWPPAAREWVVYDVAGIRTSRAAWFPFFDDINSIIFLAPVSAFDQVLTEDRSVNRVKDSVSLWTSVCASKILQNVQLILLLNKCDVLKRKLKEGKKVGDWVKGFAGKNDYEAVLKHYKHAFRDILTKHSPHRFFYAHFTTVVDTQTTAATLTSVQDSIVKHMMVNAALL